MEIWLWLERLAGATNVKDEALRMAAVVEDYLQLSEVPNMLQICWKKPSFVELGQEQQFYIVAEAPASLDVHPRLNKTHARTMRYLSVAGRIVKWHPPK